MKTIAKIVLIGLTVSFAACSTVAGAGKDITNAAEWTKEKMGGSK
jgi:predicted small secreted protein